MQHFKLEYVCCDLCGRNDAETILHKMGELVRNEFNIVKCRNCGLIYVNPRLPKEATTLLYDNAYYRGEGFDKTWSCMSDLEDTHAKRYKSFRALLKRYCAIQKGGSQGKRLLDLGCGAGLLLKAASEMGYEGFGIDTSPIVSKLARSQGFTVYSNEITDDSFLALESSFDIVTAIEVLEHLYEPKRYLRAIYMILKPGGTLFYSTGNADRLKIEGGNWCYLHPEGHLYYFTPNVLRTYFTEIGFEILDPYDYPTFYTEHSTSPYQLLRNSAKWTLLHSRFLRHRALQPYLKAHCADLLPMARKPIT